MWYREYMRLFELLINLMQVYGFILLILLQVFIIYWLEYKLIFALITID